jgi:UDP-N-acetylmuramoyl-tripeptide--D-alanyl-D-alanine ligase
VPLTLLKLNERHRYAVIEMGTNHPGEMAALARVTEPDVALITTIGRSHLEFFGDLAGVAKEKSAIFATLRPGGTAVIPADGPEVATLAAAAKQFRILRFGEAPDLDLRVEYLKGRLNGGRLRLRWREGDVREFEWGIPGRHQARNAAAAALTATAAGVTPQAIVTGLSACRLTGMRMRVQRDGEVVWINDAYNSNPDSVTAALDWLADAVAAEGEKVRRCFVCLGDMLELGDITPAVHRDALVKARERLPQAEILAIGLRMSAAAAKAGDAKLRVFPDAPAAAAWLQPQLAPGDLVFLKGSHGMALERIEEKIRGAKS